MANVLMKNIGVIPDFSDVTSVRYQDQNLKSGTYSLVSFGRCNYKCVFCFVGGDEADERGRLPDAQLQDFNSIKEFVRTECQKGNRIRISGGEPTLFPEETIELLKIIKEQRGYSIIDSNCANFDALQAFAEYADVLSVDPIKGPVYMVEYLTKAPRKICWEDAIEKTKRLGELKCHVEFKTMLFEPIDKNYLQFIHEILPKNAHWTLKRYLPNKHYFPDKQGGKMVKIPLDHNGLASPAKQDIIGAGQFLIENFKDLEGRLTCILGSTKEKENYVHF